MRRAAIVLVMLAACATPARRPDVPLLARPGWLVVAHRGGHVEAPENSLAAIREAARAGADLAELDVQTTRDGVLVLMHDERVDRTTTARGRTRDLARAELRLGNGDPVPTLDEALAAAEREGIGVYLDVKDASPEAIVAALRARPGPWIVYRDDRSWIEEVHRLAPEVPVMVEVGGAGCVPSFAREVGAVALASSVKRFEASLGTAARAEGLRVLVDVLGTEDLERRVRQALARGAGGVMTDDPARVRDVVGR